MSLDALDTGASIRLELVKLCYRHDKSEEEISARACKLENYVLSSASSVDSKSPTKTEKKPQAGTAKASV